MPTSSLLRRSVVLIAALAGAALLAWLAFGYFGVQSLFLDDKVDEAIPEFDSAAPDADAPDAAAADAPDAADADATQPGASDGAAAETDSAGAATPDTDVADASETSIVTVVQGEFGDRSHPTSGQALVLTDGSEQRFLRFEDFETDNGPDLNVYLSTAAPDAPDGAFDDDFIDLGNLSGNIGNQNYEVPADVDLSQYRTVVIWCVRFGVAFGTAELA